MLGEHPAELDEPVTGGPCWTELGTSDLEAAKRFYTELFGWRPETDPRQEAGGPKANDDVACRKQPLDPADYGSVGALFTPDQVAQLNTIFPDGVCDWSKPGVGQQAVQAWQTYSDARGKVVYGGRPLGPAPTSHAIRPHR